MAQGRSLVLALGCVAWSPLPAVSPSQSTQGSAREITRESTSTRARARVRERAPAIAAATPAPEPAVIAIAEGDTSALVLTDAYQLVTNALDLVEAYRPALDEAAADFAATYGESPPRILVGVMDTTARRDVRLIIPTPIARKGLVVVIPDGGDTTSAEGTPAHTTRIIAKRAARLWRRLYAGEVVAAPDAERGGRDSMTPSSPASPTPRDPRR